MTKRLTLTLFLLCTLLSSGILLGQTLEEYLPAGETWDPAVPQPAAVIGHDIGEWHITHDRLSSYMRALAESSDRVSLEQHASTYEGRPLQLLTITSPENHRNLEQILRNHRLLMDPDRSGDLDLSSMPVIVYLGYSVHGNEPSGSNASMVVAWRLAASTSEEITDLLDHAVILLDPSFNPDGLNRFATWVNMHKSHTMVTDPATREYNEVWPGARTNHYWFDLNRDWLVVQHPSSRGRISQFQKWQPNVLGDFHEMNSEATYFFQPGVPARTHPMTPEINQELTRELAAFHAAAMDQEQQLYYTKQVFDDFFYGKGSTYPDIQGALGILFEQASSRGHAQETGYGLRTFPSTIQNQITTSFSTLRGAVALKEELHNYKRSFHRDALQEMQRSGLRAWIFGDDRDPARAWHLADVISRHQVEMYELARDVEVDGITYRAGSSWIIPARQPRTQLVQSMFERRQEFADSLFYDISSWTLSDAFNLQVSELQGRQYSEELLGEAAAEPVFPSGEVAGGRSGVAYLFEWDGYYAPRALYRLQSAGINARVATSPLRIGTAEGVREFGYGSILVPLGFQEVDPEIIHNTIQRIAEEDAINVFSIGSGFSAAGIDLGSPDFLPLQKPEVAVLTGSGVAASEAGEIWHLFDQRMQMPLTLLELDRVRSTDLGRYNVIVMVSGDYSRLMDAGKDAIREWISRGGTLVTIRGGTQWAEGAGLAKIEYVDREEEGTGREPYANFTGNRGAQVIGGSIFSGRLDLTHPLGYGYYRQEIPLFRNSNRFIRPKGNPYATPLYYDQEDPLISGYISDSNLEMIGGTAAAAISRHGSGRVISFTDNPNFRAFWFGTNKLFLNAVFFGNRINIDTAN